MDMDYGVELGALSEDGNIEYNPEFWLRSLERRFFSDVIPQIAGITVEDHPAARVRFEPAENRIYLIRSLLPFPKVCKIMILHELIHSKLFKVNGDADGQEGAAFEAEVDRLWEEGVYRKLL